MEGKGRGRGEIGMGRRVGWNEGEMGGERGRAIMIFAFNIAFTVSKK